MSEPTKRTRLTAVYLTDIERDTVKAALEHLATRLHPDAKGTYEDLQAASVWARSHSRRRLLEITALFADKPGPQP